MAKGGYQGDEAFRDWQQERARRAAKTQCDLRGYNERRKELERSAVADDEPIPFVCECADADCHAAMELTVEQLEAGHAQSDLFIVKPGHVFPEFEEVVAGFDRYWIVRKLTSDQIRRQHVTGAEPERARASLRALVARRP